MSNCEQCIIRQLNSLKELTKDELIRISHCKTSQLIKRGDVIFEEGDYINGVFCVKSGVCKVSKMSDNGKDQIIHLIQKGDLLGERSLISDEVANLKATAINDMEVCFIPKEEILKDLQDNHDFTMSMMQRMASSLKNADNVIVDMAQKPVRQRLAQMLLFLHEKFGETHTGALAINLSRDDMASIIGTATESAIRLLSTFKKEDLIAIKGKAIHIVNLTVLKTVAQGLE